MRIKKTFVTHVLRVWRMLRRVRSIHCWLAAIDRTPHYERCLVCTASVHDSGLKPRRIIPSISMSGTPAPSPAFRQHLWTGRRIAFDVVLYKADSQGIKVRPRLGCSVVTIGHVHNYLECREQGRSFGSSLAGGAGAGWLCAACCFVSGHRSLRWCAAGLLISGGEACCMATSPGAGASCFEDRNSGRWRPAWIGFGRNLATSR